MSYWPSKAQEPFANPTVSFIGLETLLEEGHFDSAKNVTTLLAKIKRAIRLSVLAELRFQVDSQDIPEIPTMQTLSVFVKDNEPTGFGDVTSLQRYASTIAYQTISFPKIVFPNRLQNDYSVLLFEGKLITIPNLHTIFTQMEDTMIELWEKDIMLNSGLYVEYGIIADNLASTTPGYSFLDAPNNPFASRKSDFATHVFNNPTLFNKFFVEDGPGKHKINTHAARAWLAKLGLLEENLTISVEMRSGAPIRMAELTSTLIRNRDTRVRNVMGVGRNLSVIRQYSKNTNNRQSDRMIPHGLCAFDQDMVIQIHTLARPFAVVRISIIGLLCSLLIQLHVDSHHSDAGKFCLARRTGDCNEVPRNVLHACRSGVRQPEGQPEDGSNHQEGDTVGCDCGPLPTH